LRWSQPKISGNTQSENSMARGESPDFAYIAGANFITNYE